MARGKFLRPASDLRRCTGSALSSGTRRRTQFALAALLFASSVIRASAQENARNAEPLPTIGKDQIGETRASDPKVSVTMSTVAASGPSYVIGTEDVLHIAVWKEPDLTATQPVRSDGMISLPLLNDVLAAGLTPMQLAALLTQKLKRYVATPRVTVVVTQSNAHRIYVMGEVLHSGPIALAPNMTVLQALATAGIGPFAKTKGIYVLRTDTGQEQKIPFNYRQVVKGQGTTQNILLKPGDTIVVP